MKSREEREYEDRVKRRVLILRDLMKEGKIVYDKSMQDVLEESFSKARFDKDGNPDLSTIDGVIRSLALMAEHLDHKEKAKSAISLYEIQENYFKIFEINFGSIYDIMVETKSTPHNIAEFFAYEQPNDDIERAIEPLINYIDEFWQQVAEAGYYHLQDQHKAVKAVFGGDLFPSHSENIASKCGIYTDTIILPCPIIRSRHMFKLWDKNQRVYYILKHALNILQYKTLALADFETPIVVILADKEMMHEHYFNQVYELGESDCLYHAGKVFGRNFSSFEELIKFVEELNTIEKVIKEIKDPSRVLFDTDIKDSLAQQIENQIKGLTGRTFNTNNPGLIVSLSGLGRMSVSNELLLKAMNIGGGIPLIDAPTSWQYFKWKLEYDGERTLSESVLTNSHILQALNSLKNTNLRWIGRIPSEGLIEIRKSGAINDIRNILSDSIDKIALASYLDYASTTKRVYENLNRAFADHEKAIKKLVAKKWKIAGKDFGSWLVMGTFEIASAYTGTPLYGVSTAILSQLLDAPKLKDLPKSVKSIKEIEKEKQNMMKSPLGMMIQYKE